MSFNFERMFLDVFAPSEGDVVTMLVDMPHGQIRDDEEWQDRRLMADEWHREMEDFSGNYSIVVNPIVTYEATGSHNSDLPEWALCQGEKIRIEELLKESTIVISMSQFSASAPLAGFARKYPNVRVASMPKVARGMQDTGLSANYTSVARTCARLAPLFEKAIGIDVTFSTGHQCHFDVSNHGPVFQDNGLLHPGSRRRAPQLINLPAGEVCTCPNEAEDSRTAGEIPVVMGDELMVLMVAHNRIVGVSGDGPAAGQMRQAFHEEAALRNIAEVAIGCNDKAIVTGNVLEDEKAGFHWAYGRSDHLGGKVGVAEFSSPEKVCHNDIVYAKKSPIVCARLDFVFSDGTKKTAIMDGELIYGPEDGSDT